MLPGVARATTTVVTAGVDATLAAALASLLTAGTRAAGLACAVVCEHVEFRRLPHTVQPYRAFHAVGVRATCGTTCFICKLHSRRNYYGRPARTNPGTREQKEQRSCLNIFSIISRMSRDRSPNRAPFF